MKKVKKVLRNRETVVLHGISYRVSIDASHSYLTCINYNNDKVFNVLNMSEKDIRTLQEKTLGYRLDGVFPFCRNSEDLTLFVDAIKNYRKEETSDRTIIGYKAPQDLFGGNIKKGSIYVKDSHNSSAYYYKQAYRIPSEIAETWEPVYKEEYKVGDYVVVKSYKQCGEGNGVEEDNLISKLYHVGDNASGTPLKESDFCVKDTEGWYKRIRKSHIIRKATQEEIDSVKKAVINMGSFNLTVKGGKCFYRDEDISDFVKGMYEFFKTSFSSYRFGKNGYRAVIKDVTFSRTGCENSETKLSDWIKIYEQMKNTA